MKSKIISLSAISASFIAISLIIGTYFEILDFFMLVIASVFVLLPLYYNSYKGSFLAYLAGGVVAILCGGFNFTLVYPAYFLFFGIYPIVKNKFMQNNNKKAIKLIVGLVWFIVVAYVCYFYYTLVLDLKVIIEGAPKWIDDFIIYGVGLIAVVFYFIYDKFIVVIKFTIDKYLRRIIK